jgi:hypothetical protein
MTMKRMLLTLLSVGFFLPCLAWAQEDSPERGVARISLIDGDVSVRRGDSGDWVAAAVNGPLVVYDGVLTGPGSRAEIQFDHANMLRLSSETEVRISELENQRYQVQVARGTVMLSVLRDSDAQMEVDTPNVAVRPVKLGMYRIGVGPDGQSEVTVREGEAEVFTPKGTERVHPGRTMLVRGPATDPVFQMARAADPDDWDRWNEGRDRSLERSQSYQYVSRDIYGAEDLDSYGRWVDVPSYGWVWSPNGVATDWAPYRYGRWTWLDWYGWSWVSYDPWGWAPFHYGRWFYGAPYGWCWFPGPIHERYYWRPALVAFFGFGRGAGVGIGFGFGNVGWVPLAPYETFYPWYGRRYYGGYNRTTVIVNHTNITSLYRNARVANGVSGIGSNEFVHGRMAGAVRVTEASLVRGPVPVTPVAESQRLTDRQVRVANRLSNPRTSFYSRRAAPAVQRIPFEQQRRGMEQVVQRSFAGNAAAAGRQGEAVQGGAAAMRTGAEQSSSGWRRAGQPASAPADRSASWRQFGEPSNRGSASTTVTPRSDGNWQRFPSRTNEAQRADRPSSGVTRSEPIRINPPIVRERSAPRYESRGSVSRATSSAPRTSSSGGGGSHSIGGGGSHSSSGGGGSSHSGGGHGGHSR